MTRRNIDTKASSELGKFLDKYFYDRMAAKYGLMAKRVSNRIEQLQGIDVKIAIDNKHHTIDEKAQLYFINKDLPTFAFEISSIQNGKLREGWLYADGYKTDLYLLIWPRAEHDDLKKIVAEDFKEISCLLIERRMIQEFLHARGFDKNRINEKEKEIRNNKRHGRVFIENEEDFYFFYSEPRAYSERPINIVIYKKILQQLAVAEFFVSKDRFDRIK